MVPAASGRGTRVVAHGEAATYPMPCPNSIYRVWDTSLPAGLPISLRSMAFHEAGHVVVFGWLGIDATGANVREVAPGWVGGRAHMPHQPPRQMPAAVPGDVSAAVAASAFHGGLMAEMIAHGVRWEHLVHKPDDDYRIAEELIAPCFGAHATGAHAFAQRVALHVLAARWPTVCEIAETLAANGIWEAAPISARGRWLEARHHGIQGAA